MLVRFMWRGIGRGGGGEGGGGEGGGAGLMTNPLFYIYGCPIPRIKMINGSQHELLITGMMTDISFKRIMESLKTGLMLGIWNQFLREFYPHY